MSTIAYKDGSMSCDGLMMGGYNRKKYDLVKIIKHADALWGFAGRHYPFEDWKKFMDDPKIETMLKDTVVLYADKSKVVVYTNDEYQDMEEMENGFGAIGSGNCFAMGALEFGASAAEAVSIASAYDKGSGGSITTMTLGDENE